MFTGILRKRNLTQHLRRPQSPVPQLKVVVVHLRQAHPVGVSLILGPGECKLATSGAMPFRLWTPKVFLSKKRVGVGMIYYRKDALSLRNLTVYYRGMLVQHSRLPQWC